MKSIYLLTYNNITRGGYTNLKKWQEALNKIPGSPEISYSQLLKAKKEVDYEWEDGLVLFTTINLNEPPLILQDYEERDLGE